MVPVPERTFGPSKARPKIALTKGDIVANYSDLCIFFRIGFANYSKDPRGPEHQGPRTVGLGASRPPRRDGPGSKTPKPRKYGIY